MSTSLDQILENYISTDGDYKDKLQAVGLIVVDKHGRTLYSKSLGKQRLDAPAGTFTHDTVCWIASMTKLVTAICCMQLVERGLISIDDDVGPLLPELKDLQVLTGFSPSSSQPILEPLRNPLTLRTLLTHSSGFCYDKWDPTLIQYNAAIGRKGGSYRHLSDYIYPLKFQPSTSWSYGIGVDWAGRVVETLTSLTLEEYMQTHIFSPLGMTSSTLCLQNFPHLTPKRAEIPHRDKSTGDLVSGPDIADTNRNCMGGGGGMFSTTSDYAKLLTSILSPSCALLKPESISTLLSPSCSAAAAAAFSATASKLADQISPSDPANLRLSYALGGAVNLDDIPGKRRGGSCRWSGMTNPHWWIDQESGIAAVLMCQVLPPGDSVVVRLYDEVERAVYRDLVGR